MVRKSKCYVEKQKKKRQLETMKASILQNAKNMQERFRQSRDQLNEVLMNLEINEERNKIMKLKYNWSKETKQSINQLQDSFGDLKQRILKIICDKSRMAFEANQAFNKGIKQILESLNYHPLEFEEVKDFFIKEFIEVYLKDLPEFILTSKILSDFWQQKLQELEKNNSTNLSQ